MIKKIDLVKEPATVKAISESFGQETTRYAVLKDYVLIAYIKTYVYQVLLLIGYAPQE